MTEGTLVHITSVADSFLFLRGQIQYMKRAGYSVCGVATPGALLDATADRERIPVHAIQMARRMSPFQDALSLAALTLLLARLRPQIVHAHTPKAGLLGMLAAWLVHAPVRVYHLRGLPMTTARGWRRAVLRLAERVSCRLAHRVICVSHSTRELALKAGICPIDKILVLRNGSGNGVDAVVTFDPDSISRRTRDAVRGRLGVPPDSLVLGFVGRVGREKGVGELAEAWQRLRLEYESLHMVVVGPFETRDPVSAQVITLLKSDARVHFTGRVGDTAPLYAIMDVLALPTYREGFPNVALEAAAMRVPVVATRVAGCIDAVVDGVTGVLVPPADANALCTAVRTYLSDSGMRRRHGEAGRARALRDYAQEPIWRGIEAEYRALAVRAGR